ncbi:nuclear transport factor 2 family protein [Cellulosimicrobium cellulans]|uniref:nuclear transport factor 2 family protein n=1 Tax=Cellulosimicrobium cellulans TaxID=1710 RepID=UPI001EDB153E|nr:nuclear transport factor 2 family protein [Cellulosimicrobium cellulans]UKJ65317.1 nuclear transport factor 2 family protein [Cellulosimicrobium cellulans]
MTETTTRTATAVERYLEFWNTADAAGRDRLACDTFSRDVEYVAPVTRAVGCDAVLAFATELLTHVAGHRFEARTAPDLHDDRLRLQWRAVAPDGSEFATGTDVLHVRPDGLVSSVTTFLDRAPDGFATHHH